MGLILQDEEKSQKALILLEQPFVMMKVSIIIGIMIVGVIGIISIFVSMPSDTWQDNRTGFTGVPLPDENKEKIDCISRGGLWNNGSVFW